MLEDSLSLLAAHARSIFAAGIDAVTPKRLFAQKIAIDADIMSVDDHVVLDLSAFRRIVVVGAGKASAAMATELYRQHLCRLKQTVVGWINAPEGTFVPGDAGPAIHLHAARPAGLNEPTEQAVWGTRKILELVRGCSASDLVIVLLSGGGSALLVAPPPELGLSDKQAVAQLVASSGGNIEQLNTVRRLLSEVKGGGLVRGCQAGRILSLIISDVLDDSLQTIASGPTVADAKRDANAALAVLNQLRLDQHPRLSNVVRYLHARVMRRDGVSIQQHLPPVDHVILANNATAVDGAGTRAVELGYRYLMQSARQSEGDVLKLAKHLSGAIEQLLSQQQVDCLISGGEPTVTLPDSSVRGKGGRNQQLALATMQELVQLGWPQAASFKRSMVFLSGGTDGEDGPTQAAGAMFDVRQWQAAQSAGVSLQEYLMRADAYSFFARFGGLIETGPTNTNVCDLRICLAGGVA